MIFFIKKFTFKLIVFIKLYYAIIFSFFPNVIFAQDKQNYYKNDNHVNVLMYHRFGEENYPSTNIKINQFLDHIEELKKSKLLLTKYFLDTAKIVFSCLGMETVEEM